MSPTLVSPSKPLAGRSPNTTSPTKATTKEKAFQLPETQLEKKTERTGVPPQSMEYHRQVLQNRLAAENADKQTYVSPSDTIMSPCTAKLSAYKGKRFAKAKPQSLFAKTASKESTGVAAQEEGLHESEKV